MKRIVEVARIFNTIMPLALVVAAIIVICIFLIGEKLREMSGQNENKIFGIQGKSIRKVFVLRPARFSSDSKTAVLKYVKRMDNVNYESQWSGDIRNLLFLGTQELEGKWLFPDQELNLIDIQDWSDKNSETKALSIVTRPADNSQDLLAVTLYLVKPDGSGLTRVLTEVDEILGQNYHNGILRIIYKSDLLIKSISFSVSDWKIKQNIVMVNLLANKR